MKRKTIKIKNSARAAAPDEAQLERRWDIVSRMQGGEIHTSHTKKKKKKETILIK